MSAREGLPPAQSSPDIAPEGWAGQLEALAVQVRPIWPAGLGLAMALAIAATVSVSDTQRVWIAFFALGTALPAALALVLAIDLNKASRSLIRDAPGLGLGLSGFALGVGIVHAVPHPLETIGALIQVVSVVVLTRIARGSDKQSGAILTIGTWAVWAAVSLAAWGVAGSLLWWHFPGGLRHLWVAVAFGGSLFVVLGALWRPHDIGSRLVVWAGGTAALLLLAVASVRTNDLFNPSTIIHWEFYVGPAELVRQGGWLLWDVPAQYGFLSELTIAWIPTPSAWEALFILNALMSFLLATTVFVLLRSLGRGILNLLMSFIVALVACFFRPGLSPQIVGPDGYPSIGGFRFLWCVALLLVLLGALKVRPGRARLGFLICGNLVWMIGVLWSAESAIYSTFVWLPGYFLMVVAEHWGQPDIRRRILIICGLTVVPVLFLAAGVAMVFLVYQVGLGHGPDLKSYYEFGLVYQGGFGSYPMDPGGPGWVLFLAYVTTLATLMWNARKQPAQVSVVVVATAALVYATSSYFVGRSHPNAVWNLAPEVCIAFAVTIGLAARVLRTGDPLPALLRLVAAPVLIMFMFGGTGDRAALVDWVTRPQRDIAHVDTPWPRTDPNLLALLDGHVNPGDRVAYLAGDVNPALTPHLFPDAQQQKGAPQWLPLVPFTAINLLAPDRRAAYVERFVARHPDGGWLIERTGPQAEEQWAKDVIRAHFTVGAIYSNAVYQLSFWQPIAGAH
ncbi:MAG: hypothetical protein M3082_17585 [Candidatus Dormibacteraeota bacterium]|nr:hypothetical protein [Candidatus Dormibacteraeota bacterium]